MRSHCTLLQLLCTCGFGTVHLAALSPSFAHTSVVFLRRSPLNQRQSMRSTSLHITSYGREANYRRHARDAVALCKCADRCNILFLSHLVCSFCLSPLRLQFITERSLALGVKSAHYASAHTRHDTNAARGDCCYCQSQAARA